MLKEAYEHDTVLGSLIDNAASMKEEHMLKMGILRGLPPEEMLKQLGRYAV